MLKLVYREHKLLIYKVDTYKGKEKKWVKSKKSNKLLRGW